MLGNTNPSNENLRKQIKRTLMGFFPLNLLVSSLFF